jgi:hypothetical protein
LKEAGPSALPVLLALADDDSDAVRRTAIGLLSDLGPEAAPAVPLLLRRLRDDMQYTRVSAARARWKIQPAGPAALVASLRAGDRSSDKALAAGQDQATNLMIPLLDEESSRDLAAATLIRIGFRPVPREDRRAQSGRARPGHLRGTRARSCHLLVRARPWGGGEARFEIDLGPAGNEVDVLLH